MLRFQSTFPRGERRFLRGGSRLVSYFNPRSLVGNDVCPVLIYLISSGISIHVPSWGTTFLLVNSCYTLLYFNPRSLVGNDAMTIAEIQSEARFQSTFPRGDRPWPVWKLREQSTFQSTFPRGERRLYQPCRHRVWNFNPRSLVGNDCTRGFEVSSVLLFQSTFPRGERRQIFTNILCFFMQ